MSFRIFAHGVGDGSVTLTKKDNTEKLITKHRKAAKMIGDLLSERKQHKELIKSFSNAILKLGNDYSKTKAFSVSQSNDIAQLHTENAYLRMEKKRVEHKNHELQGEIRALERTIDKLIEARK